MHDGTLEPVRCGASNRCDYCAMFAATEAALVLKLDAQLRCPDVGLTTTTRRPDFTMGELRRAEQALWRQLRREAERAGRERPEYVGFVEWTTGQGTSAGGHRRPHVHHLVKGLPAELAAELEPHVSRLWRRYTGDAWVVECRPLRTPVGAIAYLALHHHKRQQAPPPGFKGRRLRPSKDYYEQPIAELRALARRLASADRVVGAVKRAIDVEIFGADAPDEFEVDAALTEALVDALGDMARRPSEAQLDLEGEADLAHERRDLEARTLAALKRIRAERPPELVRVREYEHVDVETGVVTSTAVEILGPLERRRERSVTLDLIEAERRQARDRRAA